MKNHAALRALLAEYPVPDGIVSLFELPQGDDNENLGVRVDSDRFVLRRYGITAPDEVLFELEVIAYLVEHGFPTAPVIRRRDGGLVSESAESPAALFGFVEGVPMDADDPHSGRRVARLLAALHRLTDGVRFGGRRSRTDVNRVVEFEQTCRDHAVLRNKTGVEGFRRALSTVLTSYRETTSSCAPGLRTGVIHHDAHHTNILVDEGREIVALLDFDEAYPGYTVLDVAALVRIWGLTSDYRSIHPAKARLLLEAYDEAHAMTDEEMRCLPACILLATASDACDYLLRRFAKAPRDLRLEESGAARRFLHLFEHQDWGDALTTPS